MDMIEGHLAINPPAGAGVLDIDPYAEDVLASPYPFYAALHGAGPFAYLNRYKMLACGRYDVTAEVFSDWERFTSARGVGLQDFSLEEPWRPPSKVLEVDPPYHSRTRRVLTRAMSPKAVAGLSVLGTRRPGRAQTAVGGASGGASAPRSTYIFCRRIALYDDAYRQ